jgi:anaerobic selenocysteine-containing dehydrogenase
VEETVPGREPEGEGLLLVPCAAVFGDATSELSDALTRVLTAPEARLAAPDAERIGLNGSARVRVSSPHGEVAVPVTVDEQVPPGAALVSLGRPGAPGAEALLPPDRGPVRVSVTRA